MAMISRRAASISNILQILYTFVTVTQGQINVTEYMRMPILYNYDNYHDCINREVAEPKYPVKYCRIFVEIQPNNDSTVWQQIEFLNTKKYYYRHNYLYRGLCMERCKDLLSDNVAEKNLDNGLLISEHTQMFQQFFNNTLDRSMRSLYQKEIHECVNREYIKNYNLSTKTFVNYCVDPEETREKETYFYLTILLIIVLILVNITSTIYDAKLKSLQLKEDQKDNYYEVKHTDQANRYLTAFSLYRNYNRLVALGKGDISLDLRFLDGFRAILVLIIVFEHVFLLQFYHIENTEFVENLWTQFLTRLYIHALILLELFFVLSGLFLYVKFANSQYITAKSSFLDCVQVFVRLLFLRYMRFLPSLVFVIIFTVNISYYNEYASLARNVVDTNYLACSNYWWQNVLMINNYYMKNSCLMHTWYIAADFHLNAFFLIIVIIMAKYPNSKFFVLTAVAILAAAINFGVNYILKLDSIFMLLPESFRHSYFQNIETAKHLYFSSYTNINSFLLGIVCGLIYMTFLKNVPKNKKYLGKILKYSPLIGWICIIVILYLGTTIMMHKETTVWTAAYGLLQRHVGLAIVVVMVILRGMCNGGGFLKSIVFRIPARISFQVYLWQLVVLTNASAYLIEPIQISYLLVYMFGVFLYVTSSMIAFVVAVFVECPIAEVINIIDFEKKIKPAKTL